MTLPAEAYWSLTQALAAPGGEALAKTALDNMLRAQRATLGMVMPAVTPISNDGIPAPRSALVILDTQAGESLDNLDHIAIPTDIEPALLLVVIANAGRHVRVRNSTVGGGNILLLEGSQFTLTNLGSWIMLRRIDSTSWRELGRSYGHDTFGSIDDREWLWIGPNRLRQSGRVVTSATGPTSVIFPKPFAGVVNNIRISAECWLQTDTGVDFIVAVRALQLTGLELYARSVSGVQSSRVCHWFAEGYGEAP